MDNQDTRLTFAVADYVVCGIILIATAGIGLYYALSGGRQRTSNEYFMADRNMPSLSSSNVIDGKLLLGSFYTGKNNHDRVVDFVPIILNPRGGGSSPILEATPCKGQKTPFFSIAGTHRPHIFFTVCMSSHPKTHIFCI